MDNRLSEKQNMYEHLYRLHIKKSPVAICVTDCDGKIIDYNTKFLELVGINEEATWSKQGEDIFKEFIRDSQNPETIFLFVKKLFTDLVTEQTNIIEFTDGRSYQLYTYPVFNEYSDFIARVWSVYDMTTQLRYQRKLELLHEGAYKISILQTKEEVVAIVLEVVKNILKYEWGDICEVKDDHIELLDSIKGMCLAGSDTPQ